jgi:hypothetical protein
MAAESPTEGARPKSLLICPTCGHESPPAGDWVGREHATPAGPKLALRCPDCETTITNRPVSEGERRSDAAPLKR